MALNTRFKDIKYPLSISRLAKRLLNTLVVPYYGTNEYFGNTAPGNANGNTAITTRSYATYGMGVEFVQGRGNSYTAASGSGNVSIGVVSLYIKPGSATFNVHFYYSGSRGDAQATLRYDSSTTALTAYAADSNYGAAPTVTIIPTRASGRLLFISVAANQAVSSINVAVNGQFFGSNTVTPKTKPASGPIELNRGNSFDGGTYTMYYVGAGRASSITMNDLVALSAPWSVLESPPPSKIIVPGYPIPLLANPKMDNLTSTDGIPKVNYYL